MYHTQRTIPTKERKWKILPAFSSSKGRSLSTAISKLVTRLVRHYDQEERQTDAAVHWDTIRPKLLRAFADRGARFVSEKDWLRHIHERSNKTRFEFCEDSPKFLDLFSSNSRTHWWNYNCTSYSWIEFVFHMGCSFNINSILENGLIARGKQSKEG